MYGVCDVGGSTVVPVWASLYSRGWHGVDGFGGQGVLKWSKEGFVGALCFVLFCLMVARWCILWKAAWKHTVCWARVSLVSKMLYP